MRLSGLATSSYLSRVATHPGPPLTAPCSATLEATASASARLRRGEPESQRAAAVLPLAVQRSAFGMVLYTARGVYRSTAMQGLRSCRSPPSFRGVEVRLLR